MKLTRAQFISSAVAASLAVGGVATAGVIVAPSASYTEAVPMTARPTGAAPDADAFARSSQAEAAAAGAAPASPVEMPQDVQRVENVEPDQVAPGILTAPPAPAGGDNGAAQPPTPPASQANVPAGRLAPTPNSERAYREGRTRSRFDASGEEWIVETDGIQHTPTQRYAPPAGVPEQQSSSVGVGGGAPEKPAPTPEQLARHAEQRAAMEQAAADAQALRDKVAAERERLHAELLPPPLPNPDDLPAAGPMTPVEDAPPAP